MKIGTYYYPDQWPRDQWARDLDNIKKMGLQLVHVGEFAWGTIEPAEDKFELDWLDEVLHLCQERGLDVILCTPTAIIPVWMAEKHPDVFFTGNRFGGRRHANHLHPVVQSESRKVVQALADRFGNHPSVIGWQIDNELGGGLSDQSEHTHAAFRNWLRSKYQTVQKLNDAWGCAFWNTFYTSFEQVKFPGSKDHHYRNQHETLDAQRFLSWSYGQYVKLQADVLKPKVGNRWITTNFMPFFHDIDPSDCTESLSFYSWDTYPISGLGKDFKDESFRIADPNTVGFIHDQMHSFKGRWGLMEVQPGQINWSGVPVRPAPGAIRLLLWQAIAHQTELITVYRFRQPRFGMEMWHDGLVQWDGVTPSEGGKQFEQVASEIKILEAATGTVSSSDYVPLKRDESIPTIGLIHDHDQMYYYATLPQAKRWNQPKLIAQYHAAIERLALHAQVCQLDSDWSKLPILIAPGLQMASESTIAKLYDYVKGGGHLITTGRTLVLDKDGQARDGLYEHVLFELLGSKIVGYDSLPEETFGNVEFLGKKHRWGIWGDLIEPGEDVEVLGKYVDQFYAGTVAVIQNALGSGRVTHVGAVDQGSLSDAVVEHVAKQLAMPVRVLPQKTRLHRMQGGVNVFLNFAAKPVTAPAAEGATFVIGEKRTPEAGVAVWKERQ